MQCLICMEIWNGLAMVSPAYNPSTWSIEIENWSSESYRAKEWVQRQPEQLRKSFFRIDNAHAEIEM